MHRARDPERSAAMSREEGEARRVTACARRVGGHVVSGPSFHVWDEDPDEARAWGAELAMADARHWNLQGRA